MDRRAMALFLLLASAALAKGPFSHSRMGFGWPWGPKTTQEVHLQPGVAVYVSGRKVWDGWRCSHGQ